MRLFLKQILAVLMLVGLLVFIIVVVYDKYRE
jgi:uncharacterized membrane protein YqjE